MNIDMEAFMQRIILIITLLVTGFTSQASDADVESRKITLWQDVVISGIQVPAGEYTVQWSETESNVLIRFLREGDEIVAANGKLIKQRNRLDSITTRLEDGGLRTLREISFSNATLLLGSEDETRTE
jgi:hypothetical protein